MIKCVYCGKKIEEVKYKSKAKTREFPVCSEECKKKTEKYIQMDRKYKIYLYLLIFVCAVTILISLVINKGVNFFYHIQIVAGFAFLLFPYPITSFESFYSCSIKRVKLFCKMIGIFFIVFGITLLILV